MERLAECSATVHTVYGDSANNVTREIDKFLRSRSFNMERVAGVSHAYDPTTDRWHGIVVLHQLERRYG